MISAIKFVDLSNSYALLPEEFYRRWLPTPVKAPKLIAFNYALADNLGLLVDNKATSHLTEVFSGNKIPFGADPLSEAYAGHQFGHFVPQLGDGRAILLGELVDRHGLRHDIQLKGAGRTPFSRSGDGRAALGPVMREYIVSEAMHALGIPTTRALAAVTTGETVHRETPLPGAVLTRVAKSHLRIGTFEFFAARGDLISLRVLADYAIDRHYPSVKTSENPYAAFLTAVIEAQARLIVHWMRVGFIHGVMNTDNMTISGDTIDYGPCAYMDHYDPLMVLSAIDRNGRYAYGKQPSIALWNLTRLAETLLPLLDTDEKRAGTTAEQLLSGFFPQFQKQWLGAMRQKLGLFNEEAEDHALIDALFEMMHHGNADFTVTFRLLASAVDGDERPFLDLFNPVHDPGLWLQRWRQRLARQAQSLEGCRELMHAVNPIYIPRNHRIAQAIKAAEAQSDFSLMERLQAALSKPYVEQEEFRDLALPPRPSEQVKQTFCGT